MLCRNSKCKKNIPDTPFCPWCGSKQEKSKQRPKTRANGTGTAYKRGKTWTASVVIGSKLVDGKKVTIRPTKSGFTTKTAALEYCPTLKQETLERLNLTDVLAAVVELTAADVALKTMWEKYQETKMYIKLGKNTKSAYKTAWNKLSNLHNRDIRTLTLNDMQDCVNEKAKTYDPAKDMQSVLSHCYKWAMMAQLVTVNLAQLLVMPEAEPEETMPFVQDEIDRLWGGYDRGDKIAGLALLMIYSGMMPGELLKAKKDMINWDRQCIIGAGMKTTERKKTPIVIADFMIPVLQDICDSSEGDKICFLSRDKFYAAFKEMLSKYECRPELTPYSCRHSTATGLALLDVPHSVMMKIMRQKKFSTTQRYIHVDVEKSLEAVNALKSDKKDNQAPAS